MGSSFVARSMRAVFAGMALTACASTMGQVIEDHSLPKSVVKTFHVKCPSGRLGMVRYDTRQEPVRLCANVQDGSQSRVCVTVSQRQVADQVKALGARLCQ